MQITMHVLDYFALRIAPFRVQSEGDPQYDGNTLIPLLGFPDAVMAAETHVTPAHRKFQDGRKKVYVTEGGIWALLLVSPLPEAQAFRQWITETVLPTIRRKGGYFTGEISAPTKEDVRPIAIRAKQRIIDDILPSLKRDGVYIRGEEKLQKGSMTQAEFRQLVKIVVQVKWGVIGSKLFAAK